MAVIAIEGMRFFAHHGYYKEERILGGEYIVDVYITSDVKKAAVNDTLKDTINYESVYEMCKAVMREPSNLLEAVAERMSLKIKNLYSGIKEMTIRVQKVNPPLSGPVTATYVEVDGNFEKKCGRCSRPMLCYGDKSCWCMETYVNKGAQEQIKLQYGNNCLCKECLDFFTG